MRIATVSKRQSWSDLPFRLFNLATRAGWRASKGFITLLAAIRGKRKTTVGKLTHAIAEAGRGSSMRPSLILWPSKAAEAGLPRTRWRAFVMQLPCKSEKLFYIFIMSFKGSVGQERRSGRPGRGEMKGPAVLVHRPGAGRVRPRASRQGRHIAPSVGAAVGVRCPRRQLA